MQLLGRIIDGAITDEVKITTLLRQCLVLADQLENESLRTWAESELNGYSDHTSMPEYRETGITAKGVFLGPMGAQINSQPLASHILKEDHRWWANKAYLKEPIASYERLAKDVGAEGYATMEWPADLTTFYQTKFVKGYVLNRAWQEIPLGAITSIVDTVRTRILQFALQIQREVGAPSSNDVPQPENVDQAVQTIIYGGTNIINSSVGDHAQFGGQKIVVEGDFQTLDGRLREIGLSQDDVTTLHKAIADDQADGAKKGFGARVGAWLQSAGSLVGKEGAKAASGVAGKAVTTAVLTYFGIGGA